MREFSYLKNFVFDLIFPKFCLNCQKEGNYLCQDCLAFLEVTPYQYCLCREAKLLPGREKGKCPNCQNKKLNGLYSALPYQNPLVKKLIRNFKYEPYLKELAKPLSSLIIEYFLLLDNKPDFSDFNLIAVPLAKKRLRQRGFNQAEEISKELSLFFKIPSINNVLLKTKETSPQVELQDEDRQENIRGCFSVKNPLEIKGKKVLLVDDVYTTGSTMEECARVLKDAAAKGVWGVVVARD